MRCMSSRMSPIAALRIAVVAAAVLLLELACRAGWISPQTVIPPSAMAATLGRLLAAGELNKDLATTLGNVTVAFVTAVAGGVCAGVLLHGAPRLRRLADPFLAAYYAVPVFVFYPLFIALFGMHNGPIQAIGFLFAVVAVIVNTLNGLDRIPRVLLKTARMHRLGPLATALRIKLPCALPQLFTGVKLAVAYSIIGVIAAEFILSSAGLGYAISHAYNNFDNPRMYALMLLIIVLATAINGLLHSWEQRLRARRGAR